MPEESRKSYMLLVNKLESLADGSKKHATDEGFPPELAEEKVRTIKTQLENSMELWKQTQSDATQYKDAYETLEKEIDVKVSNFSTSVYGHFGKKDARVKDFGLKPYKDRKNSKTNGQAAAAAS